MFDQSCVNRTETVHGPLRLFPVLISPIAWNTCEHLHNESVYFKELHNEQEYYWPTIYRAGAAVVSTITRYVVYVELYCTRISTIVTWVEQHRELVFMFRVSS